MNFAVTCILTKPPRLLARPSFSPLSSSLRTFSNSGCKLERFHRADQAVSGALLLFACPPRFSFDAFHLTLSTQDAWQGDVCHEDE